MTKLDLKSMASALAAAHNMSEADAEKFLKVVCDVVVDALRHDGQVKIKGLGTFKLIGVPEREMVDVNTGERITIEARNRISFSPDAVLRDIINKPFVFFDTVVLNDGVVFDDERETDNADDDDDQDTEDIAANETVVEEETETFGDVANDAPEEKPNSNLQNEIKDTEEISKEEISENVSEETSVEPEAVEPAELPSEEPEIVEVSEQPSEEPVTEEKEEDVIVEPHNEEPAENKSEELQPEEKPVVAEDQLKDEETVKQNDTPEAVNKALNDARNVMDDIQSGNYSRRRNTRHRESFWKRNFLNIFIILVVLVGASAFVYGIYGNEILEYLGLDDEDNVTDAIILSPVSASAVPSDSIARDSVKKDTVEKEIVKKDTVKAVKPTTVKKTKTDTVDPAYYDSLDARVRTGAYKIVGLDTIVKVRSGQTLKSITRSYLGEGMECYVEVFNGVKSVKPGDSLKIPKLKWKKKRR